jgi:hypothetical protein
MTRISQLPQRFVLPGLPVQVQSGLKWLMYLLMVADHVHLVFFGRSEPWLYHLTRLVYPFFMLLAAYNLERNQANPNKYLKTLVTFGLISQPFHTLALGLFFPNVMFSLAVGVLFWMWLHWSRGKVIWFLRLIPFIAVYFSPLQSFEGGVLGIFMLPLFASLFRRGQVEHWFLAISICLIFSIGYSPVFVLLVFPVWILASLYKSTQPISKPTRMARLIGYWFYPVQWVVILLFLRIS